MKAGCNFTGEKPSLAGFEIVAKIAACFLNTLVVFFSILGGISLFNFLSTSYLQYIYSTESWDPFYSSGFIFYVLYIITLWKCCVFLFQMKTNIHFIGNQNC